MSTAIQLFAENYLEEKANPGGFGSLTAISAKGERWFAKGQRDSSVKLELIPSKDLQSLERRPSSPVARILPPSPAEERNFLSYSATNPPSQLILPLMPQQQQQQQQQVRPVVDEKELELQGALYTSLLKKRAELSHDFDCAPYILATNKHLLDITKYRPNNEDNLLRIDGISERQCERVGDQLIQCIKEFCRKNDLSTNVFPDDVDSSIPSPHQEATPVPVGILRREISDTMRTSYDLFHEKNMSVKEISRSRNLVEGTVINHLADALRAGYPVDYRRAGVTDDMKKQVSQVIRSPPINSDISKLAAIKERLPSHVSYGHLKMVIAILENQCLTNVNQGTLATGPYTNSQVDSQGYPSQGMKRKVPEWLSNASSFKPGVKVKKKSPF